MWLATPANDRQSAFFLKNFATPVWIGMSRDVRLFRHLLNDLYDKKKKFFSDF